MKTLTEENEMTDLKQKVAIRLIQQGNNVDDVAKMIEKCFADAIMCGYSKPKNIAEFIRTIY
jgi:hypothetical protein